MATENLAETAGAVAAAVESQIAAAEAQTEAVMANAAAAIDHAQEQAQEVLRAAMETALGQQISTLQQEMATWHAEFEGVRQSQSQAMARISDLEAQLAATATLAVVTALPQSGAPASESPSLSTPALSESQAETLREIVPESLSVVAESPVPETPPVKARHRLL